MFSIADISNLSKLEFSDDEETLIRRMYNLVAERLILVLYFPFVLGSGFVESLVPASNNLFSMASLSQPLQVELLFGIKSCLKAYYELGLNGFHLKPPYKDIEKSKKPNNSLW